MTLDNTPKQIRWRIHLCSCPEVVFQLLTTNEGRAKFWAESAIETNGHIHFRFINGVETTSRILEQTAPTRVALDYFNSRAVFDLAPDGRGGTDLTLTNTGYDPAEYHDILPGWLNVLFPLKAAADFQIDLRNHDPSRTWDNGYADQ